MAALVQLYIIIMFCLGCGDDLRGKESERRNIQGSQDVILLWKTFINRACSSSHILLEVYQKHHDP